MADNKIMISNPKGVDDVKEFTFDYSYWSFNHDKKFATQNDIFNDLGQDIVTDSLEGYNSCIFAYGQTGSGKTHTMMGQEDSEGLIPRICRRLFEQMDTIHGNGSNVSYKTGLFGPLK